MARHVEKYAQPRKELIAQLPVGFLAVQNAHRVLGVQYLGARKLHPPKPYPGNFSLCQFECIPAECLRMDQPGRRAGIRAGLHGWKLRYN